jgi:hypothetical protein
MGDPIPNQQSSVSKRNTNVLNEPPVFWGLRILQDVPRLPSCKEYFEIYQGDIGIPKAEDGHKKTNEVNGLYFEPPSTHKKVSVGALADIKSGAEYKNHVWDITADGDLHQFLVDIYNTDGTEEKKHSLNCMLRKMIMLAPMRTNTWAVKTTGNFSTKDSVTPRGDQYFETEQILVKCHIYLEAQNGIITNILNLKQKNTSPPNDWQECFKWMKMGQGRPTNSAQNVIEPGINHVVILLRLDENGQPVIKEIYVDGDRMVVE